MAPPEANSPRSLSGSRHPHHRNSVWVLVAAGWHSPPRGGVSVGGALAASCPQINLTQVLGVR